MKPLCFVLMPFGKKPDEQGRIIDFNAIYAQMIAPAARLAKLDPIRADEEQVGGSIYKPMFERLLYCDYALADLTTANPNVYYELGVRHALRPRITAIVFCQGTKLPFDVAPLRGMYYEVNPRGGPLRPKQYVSAIGGKLASLRAHHVPDSPVFQLIKDLPKPTVDHRQSEIFHDHVQYAGRFKARLSSPRTPPQLRNHHVVVGSTTKANRVLQLFPE
jgi:hypothetical protein